MCSAISNNSKYVRSRLRRGDPPVDPRHSARRLALPRIRRTTPLGAIVKGSGTFADGSYLHFKEFLQLRPAVTRLKYAYHYASSTRALVFRYDNARDPATRHLSIPEPSFAKLVKHNGTIRNRIDNVDEIQNAFVILRREGHCSRLDAAKSGMAVTDDPFEARRASLFMSSAVPPLWPIEGYRSLQSPPSELRGMTVSHRHTYIRSSCREIRRFPSFPCVQTWLTFSNPDTILNKHITF